MINVTLRLATPSDAASLGELLGAFNTEFDEPGPTAAELAARFQTLLDRDDVLAVIAADGQTDIGFAYLTLRPTPYYDGSLAQLEELYLTPDRRSAGIGTEILRLAVQVARSRGAAEMHINVDEIDVDARRFYERHGFVNVEPGSDYRMLCYVQEFPASKSHP